MKSYFFLSYPVEHVLTVSPPVAPWFMLLEVPFEWPRGEFLFSVSPIPHLCNGNNTFQAVGQGSWKAQNGDETMYVKECKLFSTMQM